MNKWKLERGDYAVEVEDNRTGKRAYRVSICQESGDLTKAGTFREFILPENRQLKF